VAVFNNFLVPMSAWKEAGTSAGSEIGTAGSRRWAVPHCKSMNDSVSYLGHVGNMKLNLKTSKDRAGLCL
jgi:hypothetical protein